MITNLYTKIYTKNTPFNPYPLYNQAFITPINKPNKQGLNITDGNPNA